MNWINLNEDEFFPRYVETESKVDEFHTHAIEVDDETLARWRRVVDEYRQVQSEMADAFRRESPDL